MDGVKTKMTTSWNDYLVYQLSSNKNLSTLECLAPELLEPILKELHECSVAGLRAFSQTSRTCHALASPYRFKPLRVKFDHLLNTRWGEDPETVVVTLSYRNDWKTLRIHEQRCIPCAEAAEEPSFNELLKGERSFECIEYLPEKYFIDTQWTTDYRGSTYTYLPLEAFNRSCHWISKIMINLGHFISYNLGNGTEDREHCESKAVWQRNIRGLASFPNLRHIFLCFRIRGHQVDLMHPSQSQQAVCEIYNQIERLKEGVQLIQLDVNFNTYFFNLFGSSGGGTVRIMYSYKHFGSNNRGRSYDLTCGDQILASLIERRWKAVRLYGTRFWNIYLGPSTWDWWRNSEAKHRDPRVFIEEMIIRIALLPSIFRPPHIEPALDLSCLKESAIKQPRPFAERSHISVRSIQ